MIPAFGTFRPNDSTVSPWANSCTITTRNRPTRKMSPPSPTLLATTNGATLPPPIRYTKATSPAAQTSEIDDQRRQGEEQEAAGPVDLREERPEPGEVPLARPEDPHPISFFEGGGFASSTPTSRPAVAEVGEDRGEPARPVGAEAPGRGRDQLDERVLAVQQLDHVGVVGVHPDEAAVRAAQHEAQVALLGLEPLQPRARRAAAGCESAAPSSSEPGDRAEDDRLAARRLAAASPRRAARRRRARRSRRRGAPSAPRSSRRRRTCRRSTRRPRRGPAGSITILACCRETVSPSIRIRLSVPRPSVSGPRRAGSAGRRRRRARASRGPGPACRRRCRRRRCARPGVGSFGRASH